MTTEPSGTTPPSGRGSRLLDFISALVATFLGVWLAFTAEGCRQRDHLRAKLCMAFLESKQNALVCIQAQGLYAEAPPKEPLRRPSTSAALNALSDPKLLSVVPYEEVNLLRLYVHRLDIFTDVLDRLERMLDQQGRSSFAPPEGFLSLYRANVAQAAAHTKAVQERLEAYHKKWGERSQPRVDAIDAEIEEYKERILAGSIGTADE